MLICRQAGSYCRFETEIKLKQGAISKQKGKGGISSSGLGCWFFLVQQDIFLRVEVGVWIVSTQCSNIRFKMTLKSRNLGKTLDRGESVK